MSNTSRISYFALALVLVGLNVALALQNRSLKSRVEAAELKALQTFEAKAGTVVPSLTGIDFTSGKMVEYTYGIDGRPTLVLSFSPFCGVCEENWPFWQTVIDRFPQEEVRIVAVDLTAKAEWQYLLEHGLGENVPVITELDPASLRDYHLRYTPQTLLICPNGVVEKVWTGRLRESAVTDLNDRIRTIGEKGKSGDRKDDGG